MPRVLSPGVTGFPHHPTSRENYQECVAENKDSLRQRLRCPGDYTRRDSLGRSYIVTQVRMNKWALSLFNNI